MFSNSQAVTETTSALVSSSINIHTPAWFECLKTVQPCYHCTTLCCLINVTHATSGSETRG